MKERKQWIIGKRASHLHKSTLDYLLMEWIKRSQIYLIFQGCQRMSLMILSCKLVGCLVYDGQVHPKVFLTHPNVYNDPNFNYNNSFGDHIMGRCITKGTLPST